MIGFNTKSQREKEDEDINEEENLVEEEFIKVEDKKKKKRKGIIKEEEEKEQLPEKEYKKPKKKYQAKDKERENTNIGGSELDKSIIIDNEEENTIIAPKKIKELIIEAIQDTGVIDILVKNESIDDEAAINKAVDLLFDLKVEGQLDSQVLSNSYSNAGTKPHASCHPCADRLLELFGKDVEEKQVQAKVAEPVEFGKALSVQVAQDINTTHADNAQGFIHRVTFGTHSFTLVVRFGGVEILQAFANDGSLYQYMQRKQVWEYAERNNIITALENMTSEDKRAEGQYDILPPEPSSGDKRGEYTYLESDKDDEVYDTGITIGWKRAKLKDGLQQIIQNKVKGNAKIFQYYFDPVNGLDL